MMRRDSRGWLFHGVIGGLNLLLFGMFSVITTTPPVLAMSTIQHTPAPAAVLPERVVRQGVPTHISIGSLAIDIDVSEGIYDDATESWTVDDTRAYYATMSVPINDNNGTTLIYGHAQSPVFARLPEIQTGAEAIVTTNSGYRFYYRYESMRQVVPSDISVLRADGNPTLVLQTCMGAWDVYRGLFTFTLVLVEKI